MLPSDVKERIDAYLKNPECGILLVGKHGLGMTDAAFDMAAKLLGNGITAKELLEKPVPDFCTVHPGIKEKDKKGNITYKSTIGVDELVQIFNLSSLASLSGNKKVVIIPSFEKLTNAAQNRLLKTLEEKSDLVIIGVCHDLSKVIGTVRSRMASVEFHPLSISVYSSQYAGQDMPFLYYLSSGAIGQVESVRPVLDTARKVVEAISCRELDNLFQIFNVWKENDKESFFSVYQKNIPGLISVITAFILETMAYRTNTSDHTDFSAVYIQTAAALYSDEEFCTLLSILSNEAVACKYQSYNKEDFFLFVARLVELK